MLLGEKTPFPTAYDPALLCGIPRDTSRNNLGINAADLFDGFDIWNCYEMYWLNANGNPQVAVLQMKIPCHSPKLVESKSLKLFLGSFNNTKFADKSQVKQCIHEHICALLEIEDFELTLFGPNDWDRLVPGVPVGLCVDDFNIVDEVNLKVQAEHVHETLYSNLLRSICPVTGQPDFATIVVNYSGRRLVPASLFGYITAMRNHRGFHEEVCEIIFRDVQAVTQADSLSVSCHFTRRGGIDINPVRVSPGAETTQVVTRFSRQ